MEWLFIFNVCKLLSVVLYSLEKNVRMVYFTRFSIVRCPIFVV